MADAKKTPPAQNAEPSIQMIAQYVKDFSFENPHAPESLVSGWPAPETNVEVSMSQRQVNDNTFESNLKFRIEAKNKQDGKMAFIIDLQYAALVALVNVPKENYMAVLAVEVPKLLFPFMREIVSNTTARGGYPPLYLTPINFEAIYMMEVKRQQDEKAKKGSKA